MGGVWVAFNGISDVGQNNEQVQSQGEATSDVKTVVVKEESAVIDAVKRIRPSVVSIVATKDLETMYNENDYQGNDPFQEYFFGPEGVPKKNGNDISDDSQEKQAIGGGTGFFISKDGLILTNKHVVSTDGADYMVITSDGEEYTAEILATDPVQDIAILKIEGTNFKVAELGDSDSLEIGQTVVAIGNTLGEYSHTVTKGVVSGLGRSITAGDGFSGPKETITNVIQTDAAINPGNSGGPLTNIDGQVIGINTAIDVSGQLLGFAIPINDAKQDVDMVKKEGKIVKPYIGVRYVPVTKKIAEQNSLSVDYGVLIVRGETEGDVAVVSGSPADKAGLLENDIILEIDGKKIDATVDLSKEITKHTVGETITLKILSKGEEKEIEVILEERT
ncbi:trypsin-like peptidase domain-containing protein [Patescibacteria group bacterium]|nr:trypsin-like peptidase domain-containing protein [Patescibacteria group bacterium]